MTEAGRLPGERVLPDGTIVHLRYIRDGDAAALKEGYEHLSPGSRYRRFNGVVGSLGDATLRYFTHVDGDHHVAIVATTTGDARARGLGVARFVRTVEAPTIAEIAITVADEMQHRGLGSVLIRALAGVATAHGVRRFCGQTSPDNVPMLRLLHELGPVVSRIEGTELLFEVTLG